jgi:hypothetical protein
VSFTFAAPRSGWSGGAVVVAVVVGAVVAGAVVAVGAVVAATVVADGATVVGSSVVVADGPLDAVVVGATDAEVSELHAAAATRSTDKEPAARNFFIAPP